MELFAQKLVESHAAYFQNPIPRVVYLQYFIAPEMFRLFDDGFTRQLIQTLADFLRKRNPALSVEKSESLAEVCHSCYNAILIQALRSDESHRQQLYAELQALLTAYLRPHFGDETLFSQVMKVMICPRCDSQRIAKNGHRYGRQRYICSDCGRQFLEKNVI